MADNSVDDDNDLNWNTDDEIDNFQSSPTETSVQPALTNLVRVSDETVARFFDMGFSVDMIRRAVEETGGDNEELILETLFKYSASSEASSSKSKVLDQLIQMGFSEELVIKAIHQYGEENIDELTNALLNYAETGEFPETENKDINNMSDNNDEEANPFAGLTSSDEEDELNPSNEDDRLQALIEMKYSREEASTALERCGENASVAEVVDFIFAVHMARQLDEFYGVPDEEQPRVNNKKRRVSNEQPTRKRKPNIDYELIRLPNPMIGFGVPNEPGLMTQRPVQVPDVALRRPYFYYENVAMAPKGVWATISRHLYDIIPEFVDSIYFCPSARKRGYIHNLPIENRFQLRPQPHDTIQEAFPSCKHWWPTWDKRTKLNCLLTCVGSAKLSNRIRTALEEHGGDANVHKAVVEQCRKWNLLWVGKNKVAPLEPHEMEQLLGFPIDHTRGLSRTDRYKALGNSFQVDTVAYHLSVLKPLFPNGIKVLSLFTGIGGGEVALHLLNIPMKVVVSVEISEANRSVLRSFWEQTDQRGILREFADVQELDTRVIEELMDQYGGFDLVIGGSPCNNLAGGNRVSRTGLAGDQSSLFFEYCRILDTVRNKTARMGI